MWAQREPAPATVTHSDGKKKRSEAVRVFSEAEPDCGSGVGDVGQKWSNTSGVQQPQPPAPQSHGPVPTPEGLGSPVQGGQHG